MKATLKIMGISLVVFIAIALVQEREVFLGAWFGDSSQGPAISEDDRRAAEATVRTLLAVMRHAYASAGDERFLERLPASAGVAEEIRRDLTYLRRNHRTQELELMGFVVDSLDVVGADRLSLLSTEHWVIRTRWIDGSGESDPPRSQIVGARYHLIREQDRWIVSWWETVPRREGGGS